MLLLLILWLGSPITSSIEVIPETPGAITVPVPKALPVFLATKLWPTLGQVLVEDQHFASQ